MARQHVGCGDGALGCDAIAGADITVIDKHAGPRQWPVGQQRSRLDRQPVDIFNLHIMRLPYADAHNRDIAIMGMEPGHETGLRAGTAGGNHNPFRVEILGRDLLQDFLRTGYIPQRPDLVRSAAGDEIGIIAGGAQRVGYGLCLGIHIQT